MLIVSPNLALDHLIEIPELKVNSVSRSSRSGLSAGGKGANVARVLKSLGVPHVLVGFIGGQSGEIYKTIASEESIEIRPVSFSGDTRLSTIIVESSGACTVINGVGRVEDPAAALDYAARVHELMNAHSNVIFTGSIPLGIDQNLYAKLISAARPGQRIFIDASGESLASALQYAPEIVKINLEEAESVTGTMSQSTTYRRRAMCSALRLRSLGAHLAVVTIGSRGAAVASDSGTFLLRGFPSSVVNTVGAGDSFMAGLAAAVETGMPIARACLRAVATSAASVETFIPGKIDKNRVATIERQLQSNGSSNMTCS
jgi:tagatose 6-phosphate kinase